MNNLLKSGITSLLKLAIVFIPMKALAIESPEYSVILEDGKVEYRQYEPYIVAETFVSNSSGAGSAVNEGFMRLFRYITGNNSSQLDIDMTAPVQQTVVSEEIAMTAPVQRIEAPEGWHISFMLPGKFDLDSAPLPDDQRIKLRQVPGQLMAVVRYSGRWTERNYEKQKTNLLKSITEADLEPIGEVEFAAYDAPYVLPFLRRNEVMVKVESVPLSETALASDS